MTVSAPSVLAENIPEALTSGRRFVAWRYEVRKGQPKPAKMPYSPIMDDPRAGASSTNPSHWTTFEKALGYAEVAGLDGIMRAFDPSDGLAGLDLDNCRDPETGQLTPEAAERVKRADTYTEVSPSGTGVKLWMYATLPPHGRKRGDVEMYSAGRFFTLTGQHLPGTPREVCYRPDFMLALHREVFGEAIDPIAAADDPDRPVPALQLGDEDVIRLASESAHNGERFRRLWSGDTSGYAVDGNGGASEADAALCELLAYYGGPDRERIERLFPRSGLYREKWDRDDYRKRTIDLALRGKTRFHGDSMPPAPAIGSDALGDGAELLRVRGLLLDRDDKIESLESTIAQQQAIVRRDREQRQALAETLRCITDVLAIPTATLHPAGKVLTIVTVLEAHSRDGRGVATLPTSALVKRSGLSKNTVNDFMQDLAARDGSPIDRRIRSEWVDLDDGSRIRETISLVSPRYLTVNESLTAVISMSGPSDKALAKAKAKRDRETERERRNTPFGECSEGDNDTVAVVGRCPRHDEIVGETIVRREDFELLNPNRRDPLSGPTPTVSVRTYDPNRRDPLRIGGDGVTARTRLLQSELPLQGDPTGPAGAAPPVRSEMRSADARLDPVGAPAPGAHQEDSLRAAGHHARGTSLRGDADGGLHASGDRRSSIRVEAPVLASLRSLPWRCRCDCGCRSFERYPTQPGPGERWRCEGCGHGPPAAIAGGSE